MRKKLVVEGGGFGQSFTDDDFPSVELFVDFEFEEEPEFLNARLTDEGFIFDVVDTQTGGVLDTKAMTFGEMLQWVKS